MPPELAARVRQVNGTEPKRFDVILLEGRADEIRPLLRDVAAADGPITPVLNLLSHDVAAGGIYPPDMLLVERRVSTNTAAAGGNAALMAL